MIWYDASTKLPVAPGSCEDAGVPSIDGYTCLRCHKHVDPVWENHSVYLNSKIIVNIGVCPECGWVMLTTLL